MSKNILLIGGTQGIGREIINKLDSDHNIIVASRDRGDLPEDYKHIPYDALEDELDTDQLPDELHGFAFCPGSINLKPFKMMKQNDYEKDININYLSMVRTLKGVMPLLNGDDPSSIVLFSTVAVGTGMPFHTSVAGAKGAIEGFARSLAAEYAPSIRVNVIAPSLVDTPMAGKMLDKDKKKEKMAERHPMKRVGNPEDIASMASFLLSDDSSWITGQVLGVDGGISSLNLS